MNNDKGIFEMESFRLLNTMASSLELIEGIEEHRKRQLTASQVRTDSLEQGKKAKAVSKNLCHFAFSFSPAVSFFLDYYYSENLCHIFFLVLILRKKEKMSKASYTKTSPPTAKTFIYSAENKQAVFPAGEQR